METHDSSRRKRAPGKSSRERSSRHKSDERQARSGSDSNSVGGKLAQVPREDSVGSHERTPKKRGRPRGSAGGRADAARATSRTAKNSTSTTAARLRSGRARPNSRRATPRRKYGTRASEDVGLAMHEMKHGQLRLGRSGKKVTSRRQAIAIGLSKARREGVDVPPTTSARRSR